ncbi:MAG: sugar transferase [Ignavibacteria bacterium]|nr:sugar transferase [Ignavibacteria bacterium]
MINSAFVIYFWLRVRSGFVSYAIEPDIWLPMFAVYVYWLLWFAFFGLYRSWYAQSRLDEVMTLFRTIVFGVLVLFFLILVDDQSSGALPVSRWLILAYGTVLFGFLTIGRMSLRALQRRLLEAGIGARNTLIIGWSKKAFDLCDMVLKYPALGYHVVGFLTILDRGQKGKSRKREEYRSVPVVGTMKQLPDLITRSGIKEVLIGLDSTEHDKLLEIIEYCNGYDVGLKIIPDLYDIVSGQARVNSIYGFPLIEVMPELLKPWEDVLKRGFDVVVSSGILLLGLPVWLLVALSIKIDSRGPVLYDQERMGQNGAIFKIHKFRSMVADAESKSGPVWAGKNDPRVTRVGKWLRKLHFDEIPQFINVLLGEMSLVGPRPERPFFVEQLSKEIPLYRRRLKVRPGITGWAQVKHKYDQSVEDVKAKVKYDLFYIENMSWRMDLKILFNTFYVMVRGKGHA